MSGTTPEGRKTPLGGHARALARVSGASAGENTPPVSARTRSRAHATPGTDGRAVSGRAEALGAALARTPSGAAVASALARRWEDRGRERGSGDRSTLGRSVGGSGEGSAWREELTRTRERLARTRERASAERETTVAVSDAEEESPDEGEEEEEETVVEALERRLEGAMVDEVEGESPSSALARETREQNAALRAEVEAMRRDSEAARAVEESESEDEADASFESPNMDDPQVAVVVERARLLSERKSREVARKLVVANEHVARLKARVSELELKLEDAQANEQAHEKRVQGAVHEAVREVWAKMDDANAQCIKAERERAAAEADASEANRRAIELEFRLQQSERALKESQASRKRADDDLAMLRELASEASEIAARGMEAELDAAREEIERLTERLDEVQEVANEKVYFETENERLEHELDALRNEISWRKAGEAELRAALERSEGEIVLHRAESSKSESDVYAVMEAKNAELDEMRRALVAAESRATASEASAARATSELETLRAQKAEFESALQSVTVNGSSKRLELEKDYAAAMVNMQDLASALEEVQYELKQIKVDKERALIEAQDARRAAAEAASSEEYKRVDLTTELETALEYNAQLREELITLQERERDLLSQLDDAVIAARLADEETEVDVETLPETDDPSTPSPMKNARSRASSSGSRKMNVANLVATNRDLVELASRQSSDISRLQAERSKLRAELSKNESAQALLKKLKDDNYVLACKLKSTLQKTSDEIKARQLVESRLHEHERAARALEHTIEELRNELVRMRELQQETPAVSHKDSSVIEELRAELAEVKRTLRENESARRDESHARQARDDETSAFAEYLAHEAAEAEAAEAKHDAYAKRLQEEIERVRRESESVKLAQVDGDALETAKEATDLALEVCESTKQRALYYKSVAKQVYGKLQAQRAAYERRIDAMKRKLDVLVSTAEAPATPTLRTPITTFARKHAFLLDSA